MGICRRGEKANDPRHRRYVRELAALAAQRLDRVALRCSGHHLRDAVVAAKGATGKRRWTDYRTGTNDDTCHLTPRARGAEHQLSGGLCRAVEIVAAEAVLLAHLVGKR